MDARPLSRHGCGGLTRREILFLIVLFVLLVDVLLPPITFSNQDAARVYACKQNLKQLYQGLREYEQKLGALPRQPGPRFLLSLWTSGVVPHDETSRERFLCPGLPTDPALERIRETPVDSLWPSLDDVTGDDTHYAGRNTADPSLSTELLRADQCLAADDNENGPNHGDGTVNYLMGDGRIREAQWALLIEEGLISREQSVISVGPTSPVPELRHVIAR